MKLILTTVLALSLAAQTINQVNPASASQFDAETVARNLETPWAMAFSPDGRMFITERPGRIRVVERDALNPSPWAVIPVNESAQRGLESGLMGLAIDPQFARNRRVYVCYTHAGVASTSNRIGVLTEEKGKGTNLTVILDGMPAGSYHNGCRLKFGPDGKLYATAGDGAGDRPGGRAAQSLESLGGKVLRLNPDGSLPNDNPFPKSYVWSYGHRNQQGLAFQPQTGRLFATEHGTGAGGNNELNVIERGKNYGWPTVVGTEPHTGFTAPILSRPDAPAGATFVTGTRYPELRGQLLIATLSAQRLLGVVLGDGGAPTVVRTDVLIQGTYGRLRDVIQGPDGFLYISTSNRDGRGQPGPEDDRVLRLTRRR